MSVKQISEAYASIKEASGINPEDTTDVGSVTLSSGNTLIVSTRRDPFGQSQPRYTLLFRVQDQSGRVLSGLAIGATDEDGLSEISTQLTSILNKI